MMIIDAFEKCVELHPNNIAIKFQGENISYKRLNEVANSIGYVIKETVNENKVVVGLYFEQGIDMIYSTIAALKANVIYVPIETDNPEGRLKYIIDDSEMTLIITNTANYENLQRLLSTTHENLKIINIDEISSNVNAVNLMRKKVANDTAYIMYTSGSTGRPKGVMQSNKNVMYFIEEYTKLLSITSEDNMTLISSFGHDAAIMDIYSALLNGATLFPIEIKKVDAKRISDLILDEKLTIFHSVPTIYRYVVDDLIALGSINKLKYIVLGGESVRLDDVDRITNTSSDVKLINLYGQTESSFNSAMIYDKNSKVNNISLGDPISKTELIVVNENREEVLPLEIGEIVVVSEHVALGFCGKDQNDDLKFENHESLGRLYWTGDMGKLLLDDSIEYIGRLDSQVKVKGHRINLLEIENALIKIDDIIEVAVTTYSDESIENTICAYIVKRSNTQVTDVKMCLAKSLPEWMIPSFIIELDKMPRTSSNKIDRSSLPSPFKNGIDTVSRKPESELENTLAQIWAELLKKDEITVNQNFFHLGGHSLNVASLVSLIHRELNIKVPFNAIFDNPTIESLADYLSDKKSIEYNSIGIADEKEYYEASSAQKRMFLLNKMNEDSIYYNMTKAAILEGDLDIGLLEDSFSKVIQRHESLRTGFEYYDDSIVQKIYKEVDFKVEVIDVKDENIEEILIREILPFDLSEPPLVRVKLLRIEDNKHIMLSDIHHIVSDGLSNAIIWDEFINLYNCNTLPAIKLQYRDYSEWLSVQREMGKFDEQEKFWLGQFDDGVPKLNIHTDYSRPVNQSFEGDTVNIELSEEFMNEMKRFNLVSETTSYMFLFTIFSILLAKYSNQSDLVIGTPVAGRTDEHLKNTVGMFVNTLAIRSFPEGNKTFFELLQEIKNLTLNAFENQEYQFDELVEKLNIARNTGKNPIFDVMFSLQNLTQKVKSGSLLNGLKVKNYAYKNKKSNFDLSLHVIETSMTLALSVEYNTNLFRKDTIERMIKHYMLIVESVLHDPYIKINEIKMIDKMEEKMILKDFNDTDVPFENEKTINAIFEEISEKYSDNIVAVFEDEKITYAELNRKANQLARKLRKLGVKPDDFVAIITERSIETIVGIYGIIKSGGAYVPIDPAYPEERISYMLEDCAPKAIVVYKAEIESEVPVIDLVEHREWDELSTNLDRVNKPSDLLYCIYTSGTTGKPKGVMIEHKGIQNMKNYFKDKIAVSENDRILQFANIVFDGSVWEMTMAILIGGSLVIVPERIKLDTDEAVRYAQEHEVTVAALPPNYYMQINDFEPDTIITAGSKSTVEVVEKAKNSRYINSYGPTETTVCATHWECADVEYITTSIPIGKPIQNVNVYIIDEDSLCGVGVPGELCIAGAGVARGYLNRPELTKEKFVNNPYGKGKMYRTGDLARWLPDGNIEYLGRIDDQVKIRGFRIELGEIEAQLLTHPKIEGAVVLPRVDDTKDSYLCAFILGKHDIARNEIKEYLSRSLPEYMIPSYYKVLDEFPVTINGKINTRKLDEYEIEKVSEDVIIEPENNIEERLVKIWEEILDIKGISVNSNFFELGGHSIKLIKLAKEIYLEFDLEIPFNIMFKIPTIRELAKCICNKEAYLDYVSINSKESRNKSPRIYDSNLYMFPPTLGYGMVYNEFTRFVEGYNVFNYDFIEDDNRISQYVNEIARNQNGEKIVLFGFSAGGNLAFEVAKELEHKGYEVSEIIMLDTYLKCKEVNLSINDYRIHNVEADRLLEKLEIPFLINEIRESFRNKLNSYIPYWNKLVHSGKVNANISIIKATNISLNDDPYESELMNWCDFTRGTLRILEGYGRHGEMVKGDFAYNNAMVLNTLTDTERGQTTFVG